MRTIFDLLQRSATRYGQRPALGIRRGLRTEHWSYRDLLAASEDGARRLSERDIGPGDRVMILAPNSPELVVSMFALWRVGVVLVPIDVRTPSDVIDMMARQVGPRCAIVDAPATIKGVPSLTASQLAGRSPWPAAWSPLPRTGGWDGAPDDLAEIVFTSGTTGDPKGVMLTHANILANVLAALDTLSIARGTRLLSLLPLSHMMEQTAGLLAALAAGATVYYATSRRSTALQESLQRHRVGLMICVPEVLRLMLAGMEREVERQGRQQEWRATLERADRAPMWGRRLLFRAAHQRLGGHLSLVLCGGAPLSSDLWRTWERLGVRVIQGYGATECAPIVTSHRLDRRRPGSVGWPVRGVEIRLGEGAEVLVRGPNVTPGYWRDDTKTAATLQDGWYRTGDIGSLGPQGDLRLHGRARDMIVLADGRNVFPDDVESVLRDDPAVRECTVVGKPRPDGTVEVHAAVVPAGDAEAVPTALRRANEALGPHQQVRGYTVWTHGELPRTPSLKVKRSAVLAALAGNGAPAEAPPPAGPLGSSVRDRLIGLLARQSGRPAATIGPPSDLSLDLGLDSLGRVELAVLLEEELGCYLADDEIAALETVGNLEAAVERGDAGQSAPPLPAWPRQPAVRVVREVVQRAALFPLLRAVCRPITISGIEHLTRLRGPALFVANHASHVDSPLVLQTLPSRLRQRTSVAAAADYFFTTRLRSLFAVVALNAFPFQRTGPIRASLAHCGDLVDDGESILIFPEGTRSTDGSLGPLKSGIGLLARELRVPVVPLSLDGPFRILPKGRTWPRVRPVRVRIGLPLRFAADVDPIEATARIRAALRELADKSGPAQRAPGPTEGLERRPVT